MSFNKGSEWRKWDLHVHTKDTNKNDQFSSSSFDEFCIDFFKRAVENKIAVIGVTDYFSINNYNKVKEFLTRLDSILELNEIKDDIKNIYLIPNIELRMLPSTDKGKLINIHCLFNPKYVTKLDNDFFGTLEYSSGKRKHKMNDNGFIELGKELGEIDAKLARKEGVNNFVISHTDLQKVLDENYELRKNTIIVVSNSNQDGASAMQKHYDLFEDESGSLDATRQAIYKLSHMIFSSNKNDQKFFLGLKDGMNKENVIQKCGSLKPCIHGSDAHREDKLFKPNQNRYCWIKSNPTFEGLKQVIYEPKYRVAIQENKPNEALHKLEKIELSFDNTIKWGSDKFCFSGFHEPIVLSPHLTCIIGGRGSGKSTLLNLIAEKIGKEETDFFIDLKLNTSDCIKFEPEVVENIEFLAQNTIESFATDSKKFTQAIFERIDKSANGELSNIENNINSGLEIYDEQILRLKNKDDIDKKLKEQDTDLIKYQNIVKAFTDKVYIESKQELQTVQKKIIEIESSREKYKDLFLKVKDINNLYKVAKKNNYDEYFNNLLDDLNALYNKYDKKDYTEIKKELESLKEDKNKYSKEIESYLKNKGLNDENVKDAQFASSNIENIKSKIIKLKQEKQLIEDALNSFSFIELDTKIANFKDTIEKELKEINLKFENISKENTLEVKAIRVEYKLNEDIFDSIFEDLTNKLDINQDIRSFRQVFKTYLQDVDIDTVLKISNSSEFIEKIDKSKKKTQTYKVLIDIFEKETNLDIYKLIIQKYQRDIKDNKFLEVFYDDKTLDNSSFGQKCTTAIVILLSLGNTPIIIDEPEAHLDSSLIANYLVELIKEQKQQRQIIFATHNANFVLNADAELVIKLQNDSGLTSINSFSIEDLEYREDLLRLEGGAEAFRKREKKYNISSYE